MSAGVNTNNSEVPRLIKLVAAAARTKGDFVAISTGNTTYGINNDATLADGTTPTRYAVAAQDAASGAPYSAVEKGTVRVNVASGTYTTGHGLKVHDGVLVTTGSAAGDATGEIGDNLVGIIKTGGTTVTEITVTLYGYAITPTT